MGPGAAHPEPRLGSLTPAALGTLLATASYLESASQALVEKRWLIARDPSSVASSFATFVTVAMSRELRPLQFLAPLYVEPTRASLERGAASATLIASGVVELAHTLERTEFRELAVALVATMAELARFEEGLAPHRSVEDSMLPNMLYRAFDRVDDVLQLAYRADAGMKRNATSERLYEGGGASVQTGYATILLVLETLALPRRAHLVDLGSGFGRLGLVAGLWRDDVEFTGYEYVGHRVENARASASRAGLDGRVRFVQQDLSDPAFEIPEADVYYMYDPFCDATYRRVLARLGVIGRKRMIAVVTKGNAGALLASAIEGAGWQRPERHDLGNLMLFRSTGPT